MVKKIESEDSLKDKPLEELITGKNKNHDFLSINFPVIVSCLWIIMSIILTINPQIWEKYPKAPTYISLVLFWFIVLMWIFSQILINERKIAEDNSKFYDKEIFRRFKEYKESDENFKKEVSDSLKEIKEKLW